MSARAHPYHRGAGKHAGAHRHAYASHWTINYPRPCNCKVSMNPGPQRPDLCTCAQAPRSSCTVHLALTHGCTTKHDRRQGRLRTHQASQRVVRACPGGAFALAQHGTAPTAAARPMPTRSVLGHRRCRRPSGSNDSSQATQAHQRNDVRCTADMPVYKQTPYIVPLAAGMHRHAPQS